MYLAIIILPLLASIVSGFFGRKVGVIGAQLITCSSVITTMFLVKFVFIEVGINSIPVFLELFTWIDSESLNVVWEFNFDSLTVSMLIPVLIISCLVHIYSIGYMSHDPHNQRFFSYLSLFTFMMIILVTANNFLLMFVGWEGVGICSYLLVSFWFTRIAANKSSISAFLTNRVGDCFLTIGMFVILWSFGNVDYNTVFSLAPYVSENVVTIIGICLLIGAMAKSSQIGLHVWLPLAMEGPTPVSALIHAATMVTAGVYLLMRTSPLIEYSSTVLILCLWIGAITTVFSSLIGLFQQDIKKVIAYSTMSQLGLMIIAVGLSSYNIALFHLVNHAFYKGLLFLAAGAVIHAVSDNQDFRKYGGLRAFLPLTYTVMLIASLSLVAFPFMTGFYSKDFILESAYGQFYLSSTVVYFIATIAAMFTTLYSVKVLYLTFLTNPNGPLTNYKQAHEGDIFMTLPLIILAFFSIFFGYVTKDMFIGLASNFFSDNSIFIHPSHEIMIDTEFAVPTLFKLLPLFLTISLSILFIVLSEFLPKTLVYFKFTSLGYNLFGFFNQRFLIELFYNRYITSVIFKLAGQTTKVLDKGSVELLGPYGLEKGLLNLSKNLSSLDTGVITSYALYILIALILYVLMPYLSFSDSSLLLLILFGLFIINSEKKQTSDDNRYTVDMVENNLIMQSSVLLSAKDAIVKLCLRCIVLLQNINLILYLIGCYDLLYYPIHSIKHLIKKHKKNKIQNNVYNNIYCFKYINKKYFYDMTLAYKLYFILKKILKYSNFYTSNHYNLNTLYTVNKKVSIKETIFTRSNIQKVFVIFIIGISLRHLYQNITGVDVFHDYKNMYSVMYYIFWSVISVSLSAIMTCQDIYIIPTLNFIRCIMNFILELIDCICYHLAKIFSYIIMNFKIQLSEFCKYIKNMFIYCKYLVVKLPNLFVFSKFKLLFFNKIGRFFVFGGKLSKFNSINTVKASSIGGATYSSMLSENSSPCSSDSSESNSSDEDCTRSNTNYNNSSSLKRKYNSISCNQDWANRWYSLFNVDPDLGIGENSNTGSNTDQVELGEKVDTYEINYCIFKGFMHKDFIKKNDVKIAYNMLDTLSQSLENNINSKYSATQLDKITKLSKQDLYNYIKYNNLNQEEKKVLFDTLRQVLVLDCDFKGENKKTISDKKAWLTKREKHIEKMLNSPIVSNNYTNLSLSDRFGSDSVLDTVARVKKAFNFDKMVKDFEGMDNATLIGFFDIIIKKLETEVNISVEPVKSVLMTDSENSELITRRNTLKSSFYTKKRYLLGLKDQLLQDRESRGYYVANNPVTQNTNNVDLINVKTQIAALIKDNDYYMDVYKHKQVKGLSDVIKDKSDQELDVIQNELDAFISNTLKERHELVTQNIRRLKTEYAENEEVVSECNNYLKVRDEVYDKAKKSLLKVKSFILEYKDCDLHIHRAEKNIWEIENKDNMVNIELRQTISSLVRKNEFLKSMNNEQIWKYFEDILDKIIFVYKGVLEDINNESYKDNLNNTKPSKIKHQAIKALTDRKNSLLKVLNVLDEDKKNLISGRIEDKFNREIHIDKKEYRSLNSVRENLYHTHGNDITKSVIKISDKINHSVSNRGWLSLFKNREVLVEQYKELLTNVRNDHERIRKTIRSDIKTNKNNEALWKKNKEMLNALDKERSRIISVLKKGAKLYEDSLNICFWDKLYIDVYPKTGKGLDALSSFADEKSRDIEETIQQLKNKGHQQLISEFANKSEDEIKKYFTSLAVKIKHDYYRIAEEISKEKSNCSVGDKADLTLQAKRQNNKRITINTQLCAIAKPIENSRGFEFWKGIWDSQFPNNKVDRFGYAKDNLPGGSNK